MAHAELVIDGDGHIVEPPDVWTARMDRRKWGDAIPEMRRAENGRLAWHMGGLLVAQSGAIASAAGMDLMEVVAKGLEWNQGQPGAWDPRARVEVLDAEGQDAAVLYPTTALVFGPLDPNPALHNPEFVRDCQRAYNEWIAEYCRAAPDRLFGMAAVPLQDVAMAVAEARRA